jgi:CubicO group peptidase (beta-lactamase class C family)
MKKCIFFFCTLLQFCFLLSAQNNRSRFITDSLDNYVNKALKDWQIPGAAVAVVKDDKTVLMKGYGAKEMGTNDKVDENTLFMIGSNTKAFTATALAMLHADKKLNLDDKVQKWLPDFTMYDPWVAKEMNIRDLLSHRLGFETFQGDFMYFDSDLSIAEVREKMGKLKPLYSFRSKWGYCNAAFMTAGEIIPKVTGQSWADYLQQKIFAPLGMKRTLALSTEITDATNKSQPHTVVMGTLKKVPYGRLDNLAPAGSISSSVNDMSKWVMALLNNGKLNGKDVIPEAAISQTRTPHSILGNGGHPFNKSHFGLYGLGWFLEEYAGKSIVAHTGGVNGFVTSVCLVPEEKLGIIVFTNTDANGFYEALRNEIEDAYLGLPFRNYSEVFLTQQKNSQKQDEALIKRIQDTIAMKPVTVLPIKSYAGNYVHDVYGNMNISLESGQLIMRFEHHQGRLAILEPLGGNRFFSTWNDPIYGMKRLAFTVENNKVKSLTVRVADFVEFTTYEFIKQN